MSKVYILLSKVRAACRSVALFTVLSLYILCAPAAGACPPVHAGSPPAVNPTRHIISRDVTLIDGSDNYAMVRPGDWLLISAGERDTLTIRNLRGEPGAPIVIVNHGGQVKIQTETGIGVTIENSQHVRITGTGDATIEHGFDIAGFKNSGLSALRGTEYIEIDHLEIHHPGDNQAAGMRVNSTAEEMEEDWVLHDVYIHHCYIHDIPGEAMYVGKSASQGGTPLHGVEIAYNRAVRLGWDAYQVRNVRTDCHVHHNYAQDIGLQVRGTRQGGAGLIIGDETGGRWHDNVIVNADRCIQLLGHQAGVAIHHNLLVHCGYFRGEGGIQWFTGNAAIVHHNTIVDSKAYGINVKDEATHGVIRDNLIVQSGQVHINAQVPTYNNVTLRRIRQARFAAPWEGNYALLWDSPARLSGSDGQDVGAYPYRAKYVIPRQSEWPVAATPFPGEARR